MTSDDELIAGFVHDGARDGGDGRLKIESDCLVLDAWWPVCFRVAPRVFAVRADIPSDPTTAVDVVIAEVTALGLTPVSSDPPLLHIITVAEIAWGLVSWTVWANDANAADDALSARAGAEPMLSPGPGDLPF